MVRIHTLLVVLVQYTVYSIVLGFVGEIENGVRYSPPTRLAAFETNTGLVELLSTSSRLHCALRVPLFPSQMC